VREEQKRLVDVELPTLKKKSSGELNGHPFCATSEKKRKSLQSGEAKKMKSTNLSVKKRGRGKNFTELTLSNLGSELEKGNAKKKETCCAEKWGGGCRFLELGERKRFDAPVQKGKRSTRTDEIGGGV